jgi:dihydroxyacetone kinase
MTYLYNHPADFADELVEGFVAAHHRLVRRVPGGVARSTPTAEGEVAVVIGGGSGHYPAFAGLVGQGLAQGAAMGNLFASPSAEQVYQVARAVESGGGVLLTYGNYAGDVLNFDRAQERLRNEGIACETVVVNDDISSAPPEESEKRRGIAGDLVVFKAAGAAAASGADLATVTKVASEANAATRSFGVAFSGCTLPGADGPLFTVPEGRMGVGMGIHGEPGIEESDIPSASELGSLLVEAVLAEAPGRPHVQSPGDKRVAVILNGLGSVKYEELFVLYRSVASRLGDAGLTVVEPEVGELVTSFQMAGVSLTVCWLDDRLEELWRAPAYTPAYRKGTVQVPEETETPSDSAAPVEPMIPDADEASRRTAGAVLGAVRAAARTIDDHVDELGRLDAVAGDGDHGIGMQRGATAAQRAAERAVERGAGLGTLLTLVGDAWAQRAGGTSGALWGAMLGVAGDSFGNHGVPGAAEVVRAIRRARDEVARTGGASIGDKTMLDVLSPYADALERELAADEPVGAGAQAASRVAEEAAAATAELTPRIGRARAHQGKAIDTPDPGAVSMALVIASVTDELTSTVSPAQGQPTSQPAAQD